MRCVAQDGVLNSDLTLGDLDDLVVDGLHRFDEAVELFLGLGLGRLNHQGARNRERQGRSVEAEVHQTLADILSSHMRLISQLTQVQDALVSDQTAGAGVQHRVLVVEFLRNVVSVQNRVLRRVLQTLSASHRNVHPANRQNAGGAEERLRNRQCSIVGELTLRVSAVCVTGQELRQVLTNSQRANTGAATTVRNGEGLVQVQVRNVAAELTGLSEAHLGVQVRAIHVHLAASLVNQLADLSNLLLKHTVSGGVGNHDAGNLGTVLLDLGLQVVNINRTVSRSCHAGNLQTSQSSRCRVGAVSRQRNQDGIALVVTVSLVEGTDSAQTSVLTGRTRVRLQGHSIVTGNCNQPLAQVLNQLVPTLSLVLRDQRVNIRELGPGDGLHLSRCVQLHSARTQRNHSAVKRQVLISEVTQVAHHLGLGAVLVENRVLHVVIGTQ